MSGILIEGLRKTIVFLGKYVFRDGKKLKKYTGTGFIISLKEVPHLVTAKHVLINDDTNRLKKDLFLFYNLKNNGIGEIRIEDMMKNLKTKIIRHKDRNVDVIIIPFDINNPNSDCVSISEVYFKEIKSLVELTDIFYLSYQPGISMRTRIMPIVRSGIISLIDTENKTILIDGFAFPGNSGSPVFTKPYPFRMKGKNLVGGMSLHSFRFIGVIGSYVPYTDYALSEQTGNLRVAFEENTGIAEVYPYDFIQEIIDLPEFQKQLNELQKKVKSSE